MGRPAEFNRDTAIRRAMQLFIEKGYLATSIDDLTTCLGISRASLYHAFGDKRGLLFETLTMAEKRVSIRVSLSYSKKVPFSRSSDLT